MAVTWGSWEGPSGTRFRVGIDLSVSGTTITVKYYLDSEGGVNDGQTLTRTGAITGSVDFTASQPHGGGSQLISTRTRSGSRGTSYTFGAKITGIYNGATPTHSRSITVPALPPSAPGTPSVSSISSTSTSITWAAPSTSNGASIERYQVQRADNSSFTSNAVTAYTTGRSYTNSSLTANKTYYWRVRAENSAGWSNWSGGRAATTPPAAPNPPSAGTVTRVSDAQQNLAWSNNPTTAAPYSNIVIQRRVDGSAWATVATLSGSTTSWSDKSTSAGKRYDYQIRAQNAGGASAWVRTSNDVNTTPYAPTSLTARKSGTGIVVSWVNPNVAYGAYSFEIQDNPGGAGWTTIATVTSATATSWTHSSPSTAVTHQYRVRRSVYLYGWGSALLWSPYSSATAVVQLAAPPTAPTGLAPTGTFDLDVEPLPALTWRHNPVDSADQSKYQTQMRIAGGAWSAGSEVTSDIESSDLLAAFTRSGISPTNGQLVEWQVRTWGVHATASPWSATSSFTLSTTPTVAIIPPVEGVVTTPRITVEWGYFQAESSPQGQWQVELLDASAGVAERVNGSGDASTADLSTLLPDQSTWTVRVRVRSGAGLWSDWDETTFLVDYPEPVSPIVSGTWRPDIGGIEVSVENPAIPEAGYTRSNIALAPIPDDALNYEVNAAGGTADVTLVTEAEDGPTTQLSTYLQVTITADATTLTIARPSDIASIGIDLDPPGEYGLGVWVRSAVTQRVRVTGGAPATLGEYVGEWVEIDAGQWQWVTLTFLPTTTYADFGWKIETDQPVTTGDIIEVTGILIDGNQQGETVGEWFIGDTPTYTNAQGYVAWSSYISDYSLQVLEPAPETTSNSIYRQIGDGEWVLIAEDVTVNGVYIDPIPTISGVNRYRAVAWTDAPASSESQVIDVETAEPGWVYVNFGQDFAQFVRLYGNAKLSGETSRARTLHQFAGRRRPVAFFGESGTQTVNVTGRITPDASPLTDWETAFNDATVVCFRDPKGRRIFGALSALSHTWEAPTLTTVTFTVEEVDHVE